MGHTAGVGELLSERKSPSPPIWCETYWELLVVQRLQLYALTAKSWGFIPGLGTGILQDAKHSPQTPTNQSTRKQGDWHQKYQGQRKKTAFPLAWELLPLDAGWAGWTNRAWSREADFPTGPGPELLTNPCPLEAATAQTD